MLRFYYLLVSLFLLACVVHSTAQIITFQESILQNRNHTGYTILSDTSGGRDHYLMAGTIEEPGFADSLDLNVVYTDANVNINAQLQYLELLTKNRKAAIGAEYALGTLYTGT